MVDITLKRILAVPILCMAACLWSVGSQAFAQASNADKEQVTSDSVVVNSLVGQAEEFSSLGELNQSREMLQRARKKAEAAGLQEQLLEIELYLADNYLNSDQPDSAQVLLSDLADKATTAKHKSRIFNLLGVASRYRAQYDEALLYHQKARSLVDSLQSPEIHAKINLNTAAIHEAKGDFGSAFKYYLSGIKAAESLGDRSMVATAMNNIGMAYNDYGQPEEARYYLQRAIDAHREQGNKLGLLRATNNLAITNYKVENYDEAIALYNQALNLHEEVRTETPPFRILYNLGQTFKDKGNYSQAKQYYSESLEYCRQAGIPQGLIYNYGGLANVAELENDFVTARDYYNRALQISREIRSSSLEMDVLNSLYLLEKGRNNYGAALNFYEQFVSINDSLGQIAQEQALAETEAQLGLRQQKQINTLLEEEQQLQQARISMQNWLLFLGVGVIGVISVCLFLIYRSNTDKKKVNTKLQQQRRELEMLNREKDKMMAVISHDLRSPLAGMHAIIYLLQNQDLEEDKAQELTAQLDSYLRRHINLLDNLLAWAQAQINGIELELETVNSHNVVDEVLENVAAQAQQKNIGLANNTESDLEVVADYNALKLILRNLVNNALKYSHEGDKVTVSSQLDEDEVLFEVKDTGIGIPEDIQQKLFKQVDSRTGTNNEKGSGLGLQLCKEFVEKQGGRIFVESTEGVGTSMNFTLPKA